MSRDHTYHDSVFRTADFDGTDEGEFEPGLVGIFMSIQASTEGSFRVIRSACEQIGFHALRADDAVGSGIVLREIAELIERCEFLVFDLSDERPNVYYELGYAHGVGNESADILIVARHGTVVHFNAAAIRVHFYTDIDDLQRICVNQLSRMVVATRR